MKNETVYEGKTGFVLTPVHFYEVLRQERDATVISRDWLFRVITLRSRVIILNKTGQKCLTWPGKQ